MPNENLTSVFTNIADAIRARSVDESKTFAPPQMANAINQVNCISDLSFTYGILHIPDNSKVINLQLFGSAQYGLDVGQRCSVSLGARYLGGCLQIGGSSKLTIDQELSMYDEVVGEWDSDRSNYVEIAENAVIDSTNRQSGYISTKNLALQVNSEGDFPQIYVPSIQLRSEGGWGNKCILAISKYNSNGVPKIPALPDNITLPSAFDSLVVTFGGGDWVHEDGYIAVLNGGYDMYSIDFGTPKAFIHNHVRISNKPITFTGGWITPCCEFINCTFQNVYNWRLNTDKYPWWGAMYDAWHEYENNHDALLELASVVDSLPTIPKVAIPSSECRYREDYEWVYNNAVALRDKNGSVLYYKNILPDPDEVTWTDESGS